MHQRRFVRFPVVFVVFLTLCTSFAAADPTSMLTGQDKKEATSKEPVVDPQLRSKLFSPRTTSQAFFDAMDDGDMAAAAKCLDLSSLDKQTAGAKGRDYAFYIKQVLDRMVRVKYDDIPDDPETDSPFNLGETYQRRIDKADLEDAKLIELTRDGQGLWRFSEKTVKAAESLYERWKDRPLVKGISEAATVVPFSVKLKEKFPTKFHKTTFLLPDYQWICLVVIVFLGFFADLITRSFLYFLTRAWFKFRNVQTAAPRERKVWKPVGLLAQAMTWYVGSSWIGLPESVLMILLIGLKIFAVVAAVWTAFLLINLMGKVLAEKAGGTNTKFDDLLVPLLTKSLKTLAVVIGLISCADAMDLPIVGLVGGLGLAGMALALASKDAVANFFGSVTVLVDRPFEIGDWVITQGVEGSVETVGFRSTRIRTFYNSLITVPNSLLTTAVVDNMGRRRYRRIKTMVGVQYNTTPEQIDAFCEGIREIIRRHPYTRKDYYHVYLNAFNNSSLDILLYCFVECPDWSVELREKHRLFVDIIRLAQELRVEFAFPTQTLHMFQEQASDEPLPVDLNEPLRAGQRRAAKVAGPLVTGSQRPGRVTFGNPTPIESDEPDAEGEDGM